jgi:hypothetical protein
MIDRQVLRPLCVITSALPCGKSVIDHGKSLIYVLLPIHGLYGVGSVGSEQVMVGTGFGKRQGLPWGLHFPTT